MKGGEKRMKMLTAIRVTLLIGMLVAPVLALEAQEQSKASEPAKAEESLKSGCQVGETTHPFDIADITGPNKGQQLCYVWANGKRPVVLIFARELNEGLTSLVKKVDAFVKENQGQKNMAAFVVFLEEDKTKLEPKLKELAEQEQLSIPLTIAIDGVQGPKSYKLHPDVKTTVLVYKEKKVQANFALQKVEKEDVEKILAAAKNMLENKT